VLAPTGRVDHHRLRRGPRVVAECRRQRPDEFAQRRFRLRRDGRRRPQQQEKCLGLNGAEAAQIRAGSADQRPPAAASGLRIDGNAGGRQGFQVAAGGGHRYLELVGQFRGGDPPARLHQQEGSYQPIGAHGVSVTRNVLTG